MNKTALITGASSGIGSSLAEVFAKEQWDLALVDNNDNQLISLANHLQSKYGVTVQVIVMDLTLPDAPNQLFIELRGAQIDALVNYGGMASSSEFVTRDGQKDYDEIQRNVMGLTRLTKLILPTMVERYSGYILNVASTVSFQSTPLMAVYGASQAYILSFSEALTKEVENKGIKVTALCPNPNDSMKTDLVAKIGYKALMRGKSVVIPGILNKLMVFSRRFMPRT